MRRLRWTQPPRLFAGVEGMCLSGPLGDRLGVERSNHAWALHFAFDDAVGRRTREWPCIEREFTNAHRTWAGQGLATPESIAFRHLLDSDPRLGARIGDGHWNLHLSRRRSHHVWQIAKSSTTCGSRSMTMATAALSCCPRNVVSGRYRNRTCDLFRVKEAR